MKQEQFNEIVQITVAAAKANVELKKTCLIAEVDLRQATGELNIITRQMKDKIENNYQVATQASPEVSRRKSSKADWDAAQRFLQSSGRERAIALHKIQSNYTKKDMDNKMAYIDATKTAKVIDFSAREAFKAMLVSHGSPAAEIIGEVFEHVFKHDNFDEELFTKNLTKALKKELNKNPETKIESSQSVRKFFALKLPFSKPTSNADEKRNNQPG